MEAVAIRRVQKGIITSMKTKAKLTLAISTLSAVVLAAGVTSTFAWFTTQSTVNATTGTLTVNSPATLKIKGAKVRGNDIVTTGDKKTTDYHIEGGGGTLGAVSSTTGEKFYAPTTLKDTVGGYSSATFAEIDSDPTHDPAGNKYVGYWQYNLAVTAAKGEAGKQLKYSVEVATTGSNIGSWYRVAIFYTGKNLAAENDHTSAMTDQQALVADDGNAVYGSADGQHLGFYKNNSSQIVQQTGVGDDKTVVTGISSATNVECADEVVTSASQHVTAFFTVAVWMEGTIGDVTQNGAAGNTIAVTVTFGFRS